MCEFRQCSDLEKVFLFIVRVSCAISPLDRFEKSCFSGVSLVDGPGKV